METNLKAQIERCDALDKRCEVLDKELNRTLKNVDNNNKSTDRYITVEDLQEVINDVKSSLELVVNQTPRNSNDIDMLKAQVSKCQRSG